MSPVRFDPGRSATLVAVAAKVRAKRPLWRREGQPSVGRHHAGLAGLALCLLPLASLPAEAAQPEAQGRWACHPRLKQMRGLGNRYDRRPDNFLAAIKLAAVRIWINA